MKTKITANSVREQLHEMGLRDPYLSEGVAFLTALFEKTARDPDLLTELPKRVERDGKTFFEAPGREPIPLYGERTDNRDAIEFYEHYWQPYELAGLLTRSHLTRFNNSLVSSIRQRCRRDNLDPENYLPPAKRVSLEEEIAASGLLENDIKRLARYIDRKRARHRTDPDYTPGHLPQPKGCGE